MCGDSKSESISVFYLQACINRQAPCFVYKMLLWSYFNSSIQYFEIGCLIIFKKETQENPKRMITAIIVLFQI